MMLPVTLPSAFQKIKSLLEFSSLFFEKQTKPSPSDQTENIPSSEIARVDTLASGLKATVASRVSIDCRNGLIPLN